MLQKQRMMWAAEVPGRSYFKAIGELFGRKKQFKINIKAVLKLQRQRQLAISLGHGYKRDCLLPPLPWCVIFLEFWDKGLGCLEDLVWKGSVGVTVIDRIRGLMSLGEQSQSAAVLRTQDIFWAGQAFLGSNLTLAGDDFTWSKAFPVNQPLMRSEVEEN